jgi:hypothetical protein
MIATFSVKEIYDRVMFITIFISWWGIDDEINPFTTRYTEE